MKSVAETNQTFLLEEEKWICDLCASKTEKLDQYNEGVYDMPYRELVNGVSWEALCEAAQVDVGYGHLDRKSQPGDPEHGGFENEIFAIRPFDWSDPDYYEPNFEHKPSGFKLWWYKYAFRGADMNYDLNAEELTRLFRLCAAHLGVKTRSPRQSITVNQLIDYLSRHFNGDETVVGIDVCDEKTTLALVGVANRVVGETGRVEAVLRWDTFEEDEV